MKEKEKPPSDQEIADMLDGLNRVYKSYSDSIQWSNRRQLARSLEVYKKWFSDRNIATRYVDHANKYALVELS